MATSSPKLEAVRHLCELGRLDEAEEGYRSILAEAPNHVDALMGLGSVLRSRGDQRAALAYFEDAAKAADPGYLWARFEVARSLKEIGSVDHAETALRALLNEHPDHAAVLIELGHIQRRRGDREGALGFFEKAIEADPRNVWARTEAANELQELGQVNLAERLYRSVLEDDPGRVLTLLGLGQLLRRRGDQQEALWCFERAAQGDPGNVWVRFEVARSLKELDRLDEAEAALSASLADHPRHAATLTELGQIRRRRGDRAGALASFERAADADPKYVWGRLEAANELREIGRLEDAETAFQSLIAENPDHAPTLIGQSRLLWQRGNRAGAISNLQRAIAVVPNDLTTKVQLANYMRESGRMAEAKAILDEIPENAPGYTSALVSIANCYCEAFAWSEAEVALRRALDLEPYNVWAHIAMGQLARQRGDRDQALAFFVSAAAVDHASTATILEIAIEYRDRGRFVDAERMIKTVLHQDSLHIQALMQLGYLERTRGDRAAAREMFLRASAANPNCILALVELAIEERETGQPDASKKWLNQALERDPSHLGALLQSAEHALLAENCTEALQFAERAMTAHPNIVWPYAIEAHALAENSQVEKALELLRAAREQFGGHPEIACRMIGILISIGERWKAHSLLKETEELSKHHFWLWAYRVQLAISLDQLEEADHALIAAPAKTRNEQSRVHAYRGQLAEARWQLHEAISHYERGLAIDPLNAWIHFDLARTGILTFDLAAARKHLEIYLNLDSSVHLLRGNSLRISQHHLGFLMDEFGLDQALLQQLKDANSLPIERRVNSLATLVRHNADNTSPAIAYLIALRQSGAFTTVDFAERSADISIPKRVGQFWDGADVPPDVRELMQTWRTGLPEFDYELFNDRTALTFIRRHFAEDVAAAYVRTKEPAQKADIFRLAYLFIRGGFYVDADDRCVGQLASIIPAKATLAVWQENYGTIGNNLIGTVAAHPVIREALVQAVAAVNRGDRDSVWLSTGPGLITRSLAQALAEVTTRAVSNDVVVLTAGQLQRMVSVHCPLNYKKTEHWSRSGQKRRAYYLKSA